MPSRSSKDAENISSPHLMPLGPFQSCLCLLTAFQLPGTFCPSSISSPVSSSTEESSSPLSPGASRGRGRRRWACVWLSQSLGQAALSTSSSPGHRWILSDKDFTQCSSCSSPPAAVPSRGLHSGMWKCSNTQHILLQASRQHRA